MAAETVTLLEDFPISIGNRRLAVATVTGPASYTTMSPGSPPTGGQALSASQFGLKYLDSVLIGMDDTGEFSGYWTATSSTRHGVPAGILAWLNAGAGGNEPAGGTDLSAKTLRVTAIGR